MANEFYSTYLLTVHGMLDTTKEALSQAANPDAYDEALSTHAHFQQARGGFVAVASTLDGVHKHFPQVVPCVDAEDHSKAVDMLYDLGADLMDCADACDVPISEHPDPCVLIKAAHEAHMTCFKLLNVLKRIEAKLDTEDAANE